MSHHLYMMILGCRPEGRFTEQHDIFFGIAEKASDLVPHIKAYWPEAKGVMHIDALRKVQNVNGRIITVVPRTDDAGTSAAQLFFINLGGYKPNQFDEFHYKMLIAASTKDQAIKMAKQSAFYQHTGFADAPAHIDDRYGVDVDDVFEIKEILPAVFKEQFTILVTDETTTAEDEIYLGYITFDKLKGMEV